MPFAAGAGVAAHADDAQAGLRELAQAPQATPSKKGKQAGMLVLILDEMDQLLSQDCAILYTLFSIPQVPTSLSLGPQMDIQERLWNESPCMHKASS